MLFFLGWDGLMKLGMLMDAWNALYSEDPPTKQPKRFSEPSAQPRGPGRIMWPSAPQLATVATQKPSPLGGMRGRGFGSEVEG